jgi:hypothetical protein
VPRSRRYAPRLPGVVVHTTNRPIAAADRIVRDGIPLTSAARTIVDVAADGILPEQVEMAVQQATERGLISAEGLRRQAEGYGRRVRQLVRTAMER